MSINQIIRPIEPQPSGIWKLGTIYNNISKRHIFTTGNSSSALLYCVDSNSSTDIFNEANQSYTIRLVIAVSNSGNNINVAFKNGKNSEIIKTFPTSIEQDLVYELNFYYNPTKIDLVEDDSKKFYIRKIGQGTLRLLETEVSKQNVEYSELNNTLYDLGNTLNLPSNLSTSSPSENGDKLSIKYGNGLFKSGLWENGVWNNGYRSAIVDEDLFYFYDIEQTSSFQENNNSWFIKLKSVQLSNNINNIKNNIVIGDYITIGNIVALNLNETRKLLTDTYRVTNVYEDGSLMVNVIVNFPIRRFERDSVNHLVYSTKNIWKNGLFLNGYFRGVWSGGWFKGFANTTVMEDSQWINGRFDGGRFISTVQQTNDETGEVLKYNTGLIQNFEFFDNNSTNSLENGVIGNLYNSWIDVNYYTSSFVNINSNNKIYDKDLKSAKAFSNLYGLPTNDILSSISYFRNVSNGEVVPYDLGAKWNIFNDFIGDNTNFNRPFSNIGGLNEELGLTEFFNKNWDINFGPFYDATSSTTFSYSSNTDTQNIGKLDILANRYGYNLINNTAIDIVDNRYSVIEYKLDLFKNGANSFEKPINLLGSRYNAFYNDFETGLVKREYFYNKDKLDMFIKFSSETDVSYPSQYIYIYNDSENISPYFISSGLGVDIPIWNNQTVYNFGSLVRTEWDDTFGNGIIYESYIDNNASNPAEASSDWQESLYGFNVGEEAPDEQIFGLASAIELIIPYIKFYEIDRIPFFNYFLNEIIFISTFRSTDGKLGIRFDAPHGFNIGDNIEIKLDENKFNPQYNGTSSILRQVDGPVEYFIVVDKDYGVESPSLAESGVCRNLTDTIRIDNRIKNNFSATTPIVIQQSANYNYIDNNPKVKTDVIISQNAIN